MVEEKAGDEQNCIGATRRKFLKDAGIIASGASIAPITLLSACGIEEPARTTSVTITRYTETPIVLPKSAGHIALVSRDVSVCLSCGTCELACAAVHEGIASPCLQRIWLDRRPFDGHYYIKACLQCDDAPCYYACPYKDKALCIDKETGTRYINTDKCPTGCKLCLEACARLFDSPRINFDPETNKCIMCDLCKDRPEGPACIEFCPALCLEIRRNKKYND